MLLRDLRNSSEPRSIRYPSRRGLGRKATGPTDGAAGGTKRSSSETAWGLLGLLIERPLSVSTWQSTVHADMLLRHKVWKLQKRS